MRLLSAHHLWLMAQMGQIIPRTIEEVLANVVVSEVAEPSHQTSSQKMKVKPKAHAMDQTVEVALDLGGEEKAAAIASHLEHRASKMMDNHKTRYKLQI
jgi:hypothetical protein